MGAFVAYTIEQLDALDAAIAEGALVVAYSDKRVQYRSLDEMIRIRKLMRDELGLNGTSGGIRFVSVSKGFTPAGGY